MIEELYKIFLESTGISTDTRTIEEGNLFFALSGENFDGNTYATKAIELGAKHGIVSDRTLDDSSFTVVDDVLKTLQDLARHHRQQLKFPIIGLTGSNGKTTTKELILSVLKQEFKVKGTEGNLNNHIGVPLTLLSFSNNLQAGVVEMGANHQKEISFLCDIAQPDYGLITNYGKAHLEGFGGIEGVKKGKSELYDYLRKESKTAIIGRWDPEQIGRSTGVNSILTPENTSLYKTEPFIQFTIDNQLIKSQLTGTYNYKNAIFAYTIGKELGVSLEKIVRGIESYQPSNNRSQVIKIDNTKIILDAYNANPSSMMVALDNLINQKADRRIAILGDMFELGKYSEVEHNKIAQYAADSTIDEVILIGSNFSKVSIENIHTFTDYHEFIQSAHLIETNQSTILIKGSRGMALERLIEDLFKKN
ncbi:UDP-N-acetylmuramoylalanyl-D-glutamyl-2,6-diaminopimelate-D-alanyl-D-alanine ligase [Nonlabens tegetincola]|uniref:UDP-N-acetylmuramoyl-tripeptide--D-alanyl-D-alanine ligase n=1 Tax=Nonlabens tegetincola TaxID=323273 RepID=A0A090Q473_9FLAO|nr:UDP-N-acetylmuramoylalanyl-D-glutamyl-2,6-diaminopimelate-D-alanyl-D-alanine ligase [Nonlabens tegetincola]